MGHACMTADVQLAKASLFTSLTTIYQCQVGSKRWQSSLPSMGCGQRMVCQYSIQAFAALLEEPTAAATGSFSHSLTSLAKSPNCRKLSNAVVICMTFTPSTIVR